MTSPFTLPVSGASKREAILCGRETESGVEVRQGIKEREVVGVGSGRRIARLQFNYSISAPLVFVSLRRIVSPGDFIPVEIHFGITEVAIHEANHVLRLDK